jgi:hypothetical protein
MEAVEPADKGNEVRAFRLEHSQIVCSVSWGWDALLE